MWFLGPPAGRTPLTGQVIQRAAGEQRAVAGSGCPALSSRWQ